MKRHQIDDQTRAVGPRIRTLRPTLTALEARVVDMLLDDRTFTESTPLAEIAEAGGVSEAMVVKIAKKLGFEGYRDFRASLSAYLQLPISELHQELDPSDPADTIVKKVFRTSIQALEETLAIVDADALERLAQIIYHARHRDFYGVGGSAKIAHDVAHKFLRIGIRCTVQEDAHMLLMSAALLGEDDLAVAFSHSGESSVVIEAATLAKANGAHVAAITNYAQSTLAGLADITLCSTAQGSPLMGENAAARIAQLNLLDALFVVVAQQDYPAAETSLERTMAPIQSRRKRRHGEPNRSNGKRGRQAE